MKIFKFNVLAILFASFALFTGCKDDSDEEVSPFVGNYTISKAELAEPISLTTNEAGVYQVDSGMNITLLIQNSLLSSVDCASAGYAFVELRKDESIFMSCAGDNEFNAGTWEEVDATTLALNMNSTAIPSSPSGFLLTVEDIVKSDEGMKGKTSVPLPKEMIGAMIAPLTLAASTPAVINVVFLIDFDKQ